MTSQKGTPIKRSLNYEPRPRRVPGVVVVPRWVGVFHRTFVDNGDCPSLFGAIYMAIVFAIGACFRRFGIRFEEAAEVRPGER